MQTYKELKRKEHAMAGAVAQSHPVKNPYKGHDSDADDDLSNKKSTTLKQKIRSYKRLLALGNLPKAMYRDKKRLVIKMEQDLAERRYANKEKKMAVKYHKIKFFERKKVTRQMQKAKKTLETAEKENDQEKMGQAKQEIERLEDDLIYVRWFPKAEKYISLFPPKEREDPEADERMRKLRQWARENKKAGRFLRPHELQEMTQGALDADVAVTQANHTASNGSASDSEQESEDSEEERNKGSNTIGKPRYEEDSRNEQSEKKYTKMSAKVEDTTLPSSHGIDAIENKSKSVAKENVEDDFFESVVKDDGIMLNDDFVKPVDTDKPDLSAVNIQFKEEVDTEEQTQECPWRPGQYAPKHTVHSERYRDTATKREAKKQESLSDEEIVEQALKTDEKLRQQYYKLSGRKRKRLERGIVHEHRHGQGTYFDSQYGTEKDIVGIAGRNKQSAVSKAFSDKAKRKEMRPPASKRPMQEYHLRGNDFKVKVPKKEQEGIGAASRQHLQFD